MNPVKQKAKQEPALLVGAVIAVVIFAASQLNIVIDDATLAQVVTPIVTALVARFFVSPAV